MHRVKNHTLETKIYSLFYQIREEAQKSHEKQVRKFEVYIEELKDQRKKVEESCKLAQDADKKKVDQIRRMHSEHEQELAKLKRSSWQEGRKQVESLAIFSCSENCGRIPLYPTAVRKSSYPMRNVLLSEAERNKQTFQLAQCGCTLITVTPQTSYSSEYITPTHTKISFLRIH
jgi:hypothetical protein